MIPPPPSNFFVLIVIVCFVSSPFAAICTRGAPAASSVVVLNIIPSTTTTVMKIVSAMDHRHWQQKCSANNKRPHHYTCVLCILFLVVAAVKAVQINVDVIASQESNQATDLSALTLDSLNAAAAKFNLTINATILNKALVFFNASFLSGCIPGYIRFMDGPYCVTCNCSLQRWVARDGGGVMFDLLPFNETPAVVLAVQ